MTCFSSKSVSWQKLVLKDVKNVQEVSIFESKQFNNCWVFECKSSIYLKGQIAIIRLQVVPERHMLYKRFISTSTFYHHFSANVVQLKMLQLFIWIFFLIECKVLIQRVSNLPVYVPNSWTISIFIYHIVICFLGKFHAKTWLFEICFQEL